VTLLGCGGPQQAAAPPAPQVVVETVQAQDLPLALRYPARVSGSRVVEIRARVSGVIVERAYREGQPVKAGDLLFRIEPDNYRAIYDQTVAEVARQRAAIAQARSDFERAKSLVAEGAVSRREFEQAEAAWTQAQAGVASAEAAQKIAKLNLGYTEVRAPVAGVASKEAVTTGNLVNGASGAGGDLLTTIVQADPAYVEFSVAEPEFLRLRALPRAAEYTATVVSGSTCAAAGRIDFADTLVNTSTGTVRARAVFPNSEGCLLSGQHLTIEVRGPQLPAAISVPKSAVLFSQNGALVWTVDGEGKVAPRPVQVQESWQDRWVLHGGVQPGERVIVEGVLKVRPGAQVAAITREQDEAQRAAAAQQAATQRKDG
jgi:membrane fusion protein (multidrug efflux system)